MKSSKRDYEPPSVICVFKKQNKDVKKEKELLEQITNVEKKLIENESKSLFTEYEKLNSELRRMRFTFNEMRVRAIKGFYLDLNEGNPKSLKKINHLD